MQPDHATDTFRAALDELETNLETPVVPGELAGWIHNLRETSDRVAKLLREAVPKLHEEQFRQIDQWDPALTTRVQQLRREDEEIRGDFATFAEKIPVTKEKAADWLANQPNSDQQVEEIVKRGLEFVIRARTQETTLTTWHQEAFQRDRGVAD